MRRALSMQSVYKQTKVCASFFFLHVLHRLSNLTKIALFFLLCVCVCAGLQLYVEGQSCDKCSSGYFGLSQQNPEGCMKCYCSGISATCESSSIVTNTVSSPSLNVPRQKVLSTYKLRIICHSPTTIQFFHSLV